MVEIRKLANGIPVVIDSMKEVRSVSFGVWVRNGSRNEREEENGISHFIEHMLFQGTESRTAEQIAAQMDELGGQINAYTTKESTCFSTRVLDEHFPQAVEVMSDMLLYSVFSSAEVQKERQVILEEIRMYADAPEELIHDTLMERVWHGSSLGMPIAGSEESVSALKREQIKAYYEKNYHTENMVISVAGHIHAAQAEEVLNRCFGAWHNQNPYVPYDTKTIYHPARLALPREMGQVHLAMAFPSLPRDHALRYAAAVFQTAFGGSMSSRLFQKIRQEHGLTYHIYSYSAAFQDAGLFVINGSMQPSQMEQVCSLTGKLITALKHDPISEETVAAVKRQMLSNFWMGRESTQNRMTSAGATFLFKGKTEEAAQIASEVERVTAQQVAQAAEMILLPEKVSLFAVGNVKEEDADRLCEKIFS